ncbi:MAG: DUF885 domain-containing protein, partial [Nocardiopsaceae bacterium]|nr:DUF885 domain-containing protein [Nocardiopsaceae bacterium]
MNDLIARVQAVCDLNVADVREYAGRHEYDGMMRNLSPAGIAQGLARLASTRAGGLTLPDAHDEAHLRAFEDLQQLVYGELELHRRNPLYLLSELDLACYDKEYAPSVHRRNARNGHLAAWPTAIDGGMRSLDRVSAPVAESLLPAIRGLASGIPADANPDARREALVAHARLVAHIERAVLDVPPEASADTGALGGDTLARLLGTAEATSVDLEDLARRADAERDRLMDRLAESAAKIDSSKPPLEVARELVRDHPDRSGVIEAARRGAEQALAFTREKDLVPYHDGTCLVGEAPESRRWAVAMITTNAPAEPDA